MFQKIVSAISFLLIAGLMGMTISRSQTDSQFWLVTSVCFVLSVTAAFLIVSSIKDGLELKREWDQDVRRGEIPPKDAMAISSFKPLFAAWAVLMILAFAAMIIPSVIGGDRLHLVGVYGSPLFFVASFVPALMAMRMMFTMAREADASANSNQSA